MKVSLLLTATFLGTAALAGWFQHRSAVRIRGERDQLRAEVIKLGIDPAWLTAQAHPGNLTPWKNNQVLAKADAATLAARETHVRTIAREIIAFVKAQNESGKSFNALDAGAKKRVMSVFGQLLDLKEVDFAILLEEVHNDPGLTKQVQGELIGMFVRMLAQQNPRSALKLVLESKDLMKDNPGIANMAIGRLAETDPTAAFAWIEEHKASGFVTDRAWRQALAGLAKADPERALRHLLDQTESDEEGSGRFSFQSAVSIAQGADRDALLAALRKVTTDPTPGTEEKVNEVRDTVLAGIGSQLVQGGVESASTWLESASLSAEEKSRILMGVGGSADPTPWLGLLQKNLPADQAAVQTAGIIRQWTPRDFNAVGTWLNSQPAGPVKEAATISFAETLLPYEPEAARRWIETLPAGEKKDLLLKQAQKEPTDGRSSQGHEGP